MFVIKILRLPFLYSVSFLVLSILIQDFMLQHQKESAGVPSQTAFVQRKNLSENKESPRNTGGIVFIRFWDREREEGLRFPVSACNQRPPGMGGGFRGRSR